MKRWRISHSRKFKHEAAALMAEPGCSHAAIGRGLGGEWRFNLALEDDASELTTDAARLRKTRAQASADKSVSNVTHLTSSWHLDL